MVCIYCAHVFVMLSVGALGSVGAADIIDKEEDATVLLCLLPTKSFFDVLVRGLIVEILLDQRSLWQMQFLCLTQVC